MRILLCFQQSLRRHDIPAYDFWPYYLRNGLVEAGHEVVEVPGVDWAEGLVPMDPGALANWRARTWDACLEHVALEHARRGIDLFLAYLFPVQVSPGHVRRLRQFGIPCVNFFCDNVRLFRTIPAEYAPFDLHWVPEKKALAMYEKAGYPYLYAAMPCWVPPAFRTLELRERHPPTFVGSRDRQREHLLADALQLGATLEIRGPSWTDPAPSRLLPGQPRTFHVLLRNQVDLVRRDGWRAFGRKIADLARPRRVATGLDHAIRPKPDAEEYVRILQESEVVIGVNRYPSYRFPFDRPDTYSRLRDLEAPMLGACYLTEWTEGLGDLYELGEEIETFRSATELAQKLALLGSDKERRIRFRQHGQARALRDHSIRRTLERIGAALMSMPVGRDRQR